MRLARTATVLGAAATAVVLTAAPALAHVTVHADSTAQGGYAKLTFRVPTERDDASTTTLQVTFPSQYPLASVSVQPHPGWAFRVVTGKLAKPITTDDGKVTTAVRTITWTADSAADAIGPGEFDEFAVSAGPLPKASEIRFPTLQTYSDGQVVRWVEVAAAGAPEPEHPAPTLQLQSSGTESAAATTDRSTAAASPKSDNTVPLVLAIVALVVALGAAAGSVMIMQKSRT